MLGHFGTLIPSKRPSELLGKIPAGQGNRIPHSLGGSLTYPNVRGDEGLPTSASTLPWDAQSATRPQAGGQLTSRCPRALDV
jgi:hypothetical protein